MIAAALGRGAGAGAVATVAMSALMLGAQKAGLMGRQPPERITQAATRGAVSGRKLDTLAAAGHLGFGAGAGAAFGLITHAVPRPGARITTGVGFGLGVWALSYAGWVPALRILPPPSHDHPGRPAAMVAAHVLYGAVLGGVLRRSGHR